MNFDRSEVAVCEVKNLSGPTQASPAQENLNAVLDHCLNNVETSLKFVAMMMAHVGGAQEPEKDEPATPGVLGKAFAIRSALQRLNLRLESLGRLL